jgi:hypothetical protein
VTTPDPIMVALQALISSATSEEVKKLAKIVRELAVEQGHKSADGEPRIDRRG